MFHVLQRLCAFCVAALLTVASGLPKIVSVPDLHGDYGRAVKVLEAAGVMDPRSGAWSGGRATLVQTGDIVDRGPDSLKIYRLFDRLAKEAAQQGGRVVNLLGNHELMNIQGDFRYVNEEEMRSAGGPEAWRALWKPESELGQQVRKFKAAAKVGPVLFVHAGLLPTWLNNGRTIEDVNQDMVTALADDSNLHSRRYEQFLGDNGPLWTRFYAMDNSQDGHEEVCKTLSQVLHHVGAERMVVGHTIQEREEGQFRVNAVCGGSLILGDTGISRAYGGEMSYIHYNVDAAGEAIVNYPGLGLKEVLPPPPLTSRSQDSDFSTAALKKSLRSQRISEAGSSAWTKFAWFTYLIGSVFFLVVAFLLIRPCIRQPSKFLSSTTPP